MKISTIVLSIIVILISIIVFYSFLASAGLISGVVGYWSLNETSGDAIDTLSLNNGTVSADVIRGRQGYLNGSYVFNGINTSVNFLNASVFNFGADDFTISLWVNSSILSGGEQGIITKGFGGALGRRYGIFVRNATAVRFEMDDNTGIGETQVIASSTVLDGTWHHVVGVKDGDNARLYIDGVEDVNSPVSIAGQTTLDDVNANLTIGVRGDAGDGFYNGSLDEIGLWNRALTPGEVLTLNNTLNPYPFGLLINVDLNSPTLNATVTNTTQIFNATLTPLSSYNLTNATVNVWYTNGTLINETSQTLTGNVANDTSITVSSLPLGNLKWNIIGCSNNETGGDTNCDVASNNRTFFIEIVNNTDTFSASTFETNLETFQTNISIPTETTISSAYLIYSNVSYEGTVSNIAGNNYSLTRTIDIPIHNVTRAFLWSVNIGGVQQNISSNTQTVGRTNITACALSEHNVPFINFTFFNETIALERVGASIVSSWTYWLGSGAVNKSLSYTNVTEINSHAFCLEPPHETVIASLDLDYDNADSQQRTFRLTESSLTNVTTQQNLYLLPTTDGLFTRYKTVDTNGNTLSSVLAVVSRDIGGTSRTIASDSTDDSGLVSFFLNPDQTYDYVFSRSGYPNNEFSLQPNSADTYTVIMGAGDVPIGNGTEIGRNISYIITPTNSSLNNETDITFGFRVMGNSDVNLITMNITNATNSQLLFESNAGLGFISGDVHTGNLTRLQGFYSINTTDETIRLTRIWVVGETYAGDYSIFRQFTLFRNYEFSDFVRMLLVIATILGLMIFLSSKEIVETSESKIAVALILIWSFSVVGWLDTGMAISSANTNMNTLAQFGSQYGIAILSTGAGILLVFRRVFA